MAMSHGVLYFITGRRHWPVFTVSLMTLRDHWEGPVAIMLGDDNAWDLFERLKGDRRLGELIPVSFSDQARGRNSGYMNKTKMIGMSPFESTVFLDADTAVVGTVDPLFITPDGRVRLTKYSDWVTTGSRIKKRINAWKSVAPELVRGQLQKAYPAINTGVIAFGSGERSKQFEADWQETAMLRAGTFMVDELAAQMIWLRHGAEIVDDRWNCSPIYGENCEEVHVWHFHGRKHLRGRAEKIWWPMYQRAIKENIAGIQDWTPAGDRRLDEYLKRTGKKP